MRPATSRKPWLVALVIGVVLAGGALLWFMRSPHALLAVKADRIDPANEGRRVRIDGVVVAQRVRDPQLGVSADAIALLRTVEMRQWQETCTSASCGYELAWSAVPIDSSAFRQADGHVNPLVFPFPSERFLSGELRLGAFVIDPALIAEGEPIAHAVDIADIPPNLAASFRVEDGVLLAAASAQEAAVGDLRVSYSIVPAGYRSLSGVQRGNWLRSPRD